MTTMTVHVERLGGNVAVLTLDRPPVNALNSGSLDAMDRAFAELEPDKDVRALVITGAGKTFSAGMDLKELQDFTVEDQTAMVDALSRLLARLYGFPKPVIAAINGHAIAGGLLLVLCTDFRIASPGSSLGLAEVRVGVRFPLAGMAVIRQEISPSTRRRLVLGGNTVTAEAAERMGIVDELAEPGAVLDRARTAAEDYAAIPPSTFAAVKSQLRSEVLKEIADVEARRSDPLLRGWFNDETKDAARAILAARAT